MPISVASWLRSMEWWLRGQGQLGQGLTEVSGKTAWIECSAKRFRYAWIELPRGTNTNRETHTQTHRYSHTYSSNTHTVRPCYKVDPTSRSTAHRDSNSRLSLSLSLSSLATFPQSQRHNSLTSECIFFVFWVFFSLWSPDCCQHVVATWHAPRPALHAS